MRLFLKISTLAAALSLCVSGAQATPPILSWSGSCQGEGVIRSLAANEAVAITFRNSSAMPIRVHWLDYDGRRVFYAVVEPGTEYQQSTFSTHPWIVTDKDNGCLALVLSHQPRITVDIGR